LVEEVGDAWDDGSTASDCPPAGGPVNTSTDEETIPSSKDDRPSDSGTLKSRIEKEVDGVVVLGRTLVMAVDAQTNQQSEYRENR
jgi:hypothetical protein